MPDRRHARELWILLVASVAVPLLLLGAVSWYDHRKTMAEAERHLERTGEVLYEHARRLFESFSFVIDEADDRTRGRSWADIAGSEDLHRTLKRMASSFPQVGDLLLVGPDGKLAASAWSFPAPALDQTERDYFQALLEKDGRVVSATFRGRATGEMVFTYARRRTAPDGRFDGAVVAAVNVATIQQFFARAAPAPGDAVSLVRADGQILARHPYVPAIKLAPDSGFMRAAAASPERGSFRTVSQGDGVDRLYAYRRIGSYPVYVLYARTAASITAEWLEHVRFYALFTLSSALLLGVVSLLVIRKTRAERLALDRVEQEVERRQRAEEILQKIQRLEMLGQIAGGIAHDFNNLLMVITSNLYLAQTRAGEGSAAASFIDTAMQAAYRGGQLTQQLLTFARQQRLKPEVVDLNDSLGTMVDGMLKRSLRGDIAVETDLAPAVWPVEVDRVQMELAVLNLAVNARDAMPGGGTLRVTTRNTTLDGTPAGLRGDFVAVTLADTGTGIDPALCERVFDPFFTTKEVGKGTGLGLSQVYGFATQAGGTVALDSRPGHGTAFTLYLPRSGQAPDASRADTRPPVADGKGRSVLLVEDSAEIRDTATALLEGFGYTVTSAETADRALEILQSSGQSGSRFDLVFSDIVMPGSMNGLDLARAVRRRSPDTPVLLTTGYSTAASTAADEGYRLLHKPYRPEALADAVRDLLSVNA